ncbi:hypothetical protein Dsin_017850 [Dipteronia sinensis]|uniref:HTH CENPB-type domain-containing protein n=1 Tax=Dipteronia sinensis TaxID=43782 RepID=A0AAE0AFU5_9ROSI|nr:hypothetical protein Dsin_017850 [Dipteronia sinensis]
MSGETNSEFNFSSGWLNCFKARHGIKSYWRFSESGSVVTENIGNALVGIQAKLDQLHWNDIYNMDETGLFFRLEADHSLATKQLEGRKKDKERITIDVCCNGGSDKVPLWVIALNIDVMTTIIANCFRHYKICSYENMASEPQVSEDEGINGLREAISSLHYRNMRDVDHILNYLSKNDIVIESPTNE